MSLSIHIVYAVNTTYPRCVPKLWTETIEEHRRTVHDATLDATAALVHEHGLASVTMSQIAASAGIGRATLYKYFPDVEAILVAWHDRQITRHLRQLAEARDSAVTPAARLEAVLEAFAWIQHQHHHTELPVALLHRGEHIYVRRADGTLVVFTVTAVRMYAKAQFPTATVYGPVPDAELRLITCGGTFDYARGSYLSNVVVYARLSG